MKAEDGQRHIADAPTLLFVGGEWREAGDRRRFDVIDPATECVLAQVADGNVDDAPAAVDAAARALPAWSARISRERAEVLRNAYQILVAQASRG